MIRYWLTYDTEWRVVDMDTHEFVSFGQDIEAAKRERERLNQEEK